MQKTKYFYPLILKNKRLGQFEISQNVKIRRLSNAERAAFFGLKKIEFSFTGGKPIGYIGWYKFFPSKKKGRLPYIPLAQRGIFDGSDDILASNYVLILISDESPDFLLDKVNLSFALFKPTSSGGYIGFRENETDVHFHYNMRIHGPFDYLYLCKTDLKEIQSIFSLVDSNYNDKRFNLYSQLYLRALEGSRIGIDLRFLLLAMALEDLYLPQKNLELSFRLSVKAANLLSRYKFGKPKDNYKIIRDIYDVRSELVHNGKTDKLTSKIFSQLTDIVRVSLKIYLKNKHLFSDSKKIEEIIF